MPPAAARVDQDKPSGLFVETFPYMEQGALEEMLNKTIGYTTSPNKELAKTRINSFICPSNTLYFDMLDPAEFYSGTHYMGVMGPGRNNKKRATGDTVHCGTENLDGLFFSVHRLPGVSPASADKPNRLEDVKDGTANSMAMGETNHHIRTWMRGSTDAQTQTTAATKNCVVQAKNIRYPMNSDPNVLTYAGSSGNTMLFNDFYFSSFHPDGANFLFADGSVHFLRDSISFTIYEELGSIAGGEANRWIP